MNKTLIALLILGLAISFTNCGAVQLEMTSGGATCTPDAADDSLALTCASGLELTNAILKDALDSCIVEANNANLVSVSIDLTNCATSAFGGDLDVSTITGVIAGAGKNIATYTVDVGTKADFDATLLGQIDSLFTIGAATSTINLTVTASAENFDANSDIDTALGGLATALGGNASTTTVNLTVQAAEIVTGGATDATFNLAYFNSLNTQLAKFVAASKAAVNQAGCTDFSAGDDILECFVENSDFAIPSALKECQIQVSTLDLGDYAATTFAGVTVAPSVTAGDITITKGGASHTVATAPAYDSGANTLTFGRGELPVGDYIVSIPVKLGSDTIKTVTQTFSTTECCTVAGEINADITAGETCTACPSGEFPNADRSACGGCDATLGLAVNVAQDACECSSSLGAEDHDTNAGECQCMAGWKTNPAAGTFCLELCEGDIYVAASGGNAETCTCGTQGEFEFEMQCTATCPSTHKQLTAGCEACPSGKKQAPTATDDCVASTTPKDEDGDTSSSVVMIFNAALLVVLALLL